MRVKVSEEMNDNVENEFTHSQEEIKNESYTNLCVLSTSL